MSWPLNLLAMFFIEDCYGMNGTWHLALLEHKFLSEVVSPLLHCLHFSWNRWKCCSVQQLLGCHSWYPQCSLRGSFFVPGQIAFRFAILLVVLVSSGMNGFIILHIGRCVKRLNQSMQWCYCQLSWNSKKLLSKEHVGWDFLINWNRLLHFLSIFLNELCCQGRHGTFKFDIILVDFLTNAASICISGPHLWGNGNIYWTDLCPLAYCLIWCCNNSYGEY